MIRPITAVLVQKASPPARVRRRRERQKVSAQSAFLGEAAFEPAERRPAAGPAAAAGVDGSGDRSAQRTVTPELLAALMTLRLGG